MTKDEKIKDLKAQLAFSRRRLRSAERLLRLAEDHIPLMPGHYELLNQVGDWLNRPRIYARQAK